MTKMKEIPFNALKRADVLVIRTRHSRYHFFVTDPLQRIGILSGGSLGKEERSAVLVGISHKANDAVVSNASGSQTESRAVFWLIVADGFQQLVSSAITNLAILRPTRCERLVIGVCGGF
jgi:hypothetical protein